MLVAQARVEIHADHRRPQVRSLRRAEVLGLSPGSSRAVARRRATPLRRERRGALDQIQGVVADMVVAHLLAQQILGHDALVQAFAQQTEEKRSWLASGCDL